MTRSSDGFLVCAEHGDIFWTQGADGNTPIEAHGVEPVHPAAPLVVVGTRCVCFCGRQLVPDVRPSVVVGARH